MRIPLSRPDVGPREVQAVLTVLQTDYLSIGPMVKRFEEAMAQIASTRYAVAVNSGTSGLHLLVRALGIQSGDEVITTSFSFVASSNCLLFENAVPVFADIDAKTLNIDPEDVERKITPRTRGILAVDVFGHPADYRRLEAIARKHNLVLIEDSCEAIGATYRGQKAGSFGHGGVFAFYPNKQITTGEGGVIVTNSEEVAELCRSMRNQGRGSSEEWLEHVRLGYNYRMDELSAALGVAQAERFDELMAKRSAVAERYDRMLASLAGVSIPYRAPEVDVSWFLYVIQLDPAYDRDKVIRLLQDRGVGTRAYFQPIHLQKLYRERFGYRGGELPVTEEISRRTLALPFFSGLTEAEQEYVVESLSAILPQALK